MDKPLFNYVWKTVPQRNKFGTDSYLNGDYSNGDDGPEFLTDDSGRIVAHIQEGFLGMDAYVIHNDPQKAHQAYRYNCMELGTFETRQAAKTAAVTELLARIGAKPPRKSRAKKLNSRSTLGNMLRLDDFDQ